MSRSLMRKAHWRWGDPLQGLSQTMLKTLDLFAKGPDALAVRIPTLKSNTVHALAKRGLLRRGAGAGRAGHDFVVTREGSEVLGEFRRRQVLSATLIPERSHVGGIRG
jgi:hypothetical protein